MPRVRDSFLTNGSLAELLDRLGNVPAERIRSLPPPGMATVKDVIALQDHENRHCELVDGVLVEKPMGVYESYLAILIGHLLYDFLERHDLGIVLGEGGSLQLKLKLVRIPDVCFISWDRLPNRQLPTKAIPLLVPDLAVEVISESNTKKEMDRKLREYFEAGVRLVWYVYHKTRSVVVYTAPDQSRRLSKDQVFDGGDVLPGFKLPLRRLFARR